MAMMIDLLENPTDIIGLQYYPMLSLRKNQGNRVVYHIPLPSNVGLVLSNIVIDDKPS